MSKNKEEYIAKIAEILDDAVSDMTSEEFDTLCCNIIAMMREDYDEEYVEWKKNGNLK